MTIAVGVAAWAFETEYGGNAVGGSESSNGITRVFDVDEGSIDADGHAVTTIVFEGTEAEARAFMQEREKEGRNYTVPVLILFLGAILVVGATVPPFRTRNPAQ